VRINYKINPSINLSIENMSIVISIPCGSFEAASGPFTFFFFLAILGGIGGLYFIFCVCLSLSICSSPLE